jgi:uncharacterized protein (DUF362 family)
MSFFFDLLALLGIGILLNLAGKHCKLKRLSKITIGVLIVSCFIIFSLMLYFDVSNFYFPAINYNMTGSEFMFRWPLQNYLPTWFKKEFVPSLFVILLFLLYPVSIYLGYALALWIPKKIEHKKNLLDGKKTYADVKSRRKAEMPVEKPKYCIVRDPNVRIAVEKAINGLDSDGIKKFVKPDDSVKTVLIKVNICGGIPDNPGSFTSQEVVGYVIDLIDKEVGEKNIIICDADMIWTKFSENASAMGWYKWVEKRQNKRLKDVKLVNLSETTLTYFDFGVGSIFKRDKKRPNQEIVSTEMLNADVIISIPKMKTHLLTSVTLGMKNMYGTFPEEDKARFHTEGINDVIYWVNNAFPPNLTIIDGIIGGEAIGPLSVSEIEDYNTIIASNSAPIADAIASKLIGYCDPFNQIEYLKCTKKKELDDDKSPNERFLLSEMHEDVHKTLKELTHHHHLPQNSKDGNWKHPESEIAKGYEHLMENILAIPGMEFFFNIGADFLLFDLARIPLLKYFNEAILDFLYEAPRFWTPQKTIETNLTRRDRWINFIVFFFFAIFSIIYFVNNYIFDKTGHRAIFHDLGWSQWIILGFSLSIILFALFALILRMKTKNLVGITVASWVVALFVESFATYAKWWNYLYENNGTISYNGLTVPAIPYYPLFSIPIFIVIIISISYFIFKPIFAYVDLEGERFKWVPFGVITVLLLALLYLEGYLSNVSIETIPPILAIYLALGIIGLYHNQKQRLEWNLSIAIVALVLGGTMEYLGFRSGFWNYPALLNYPKPPLNYFPIFVSLTWAWNTWAACGLAQILGIDMSKAFPFTEKIDENKKEEDAKMVTEPVESIFGNNAGIVWKALNQNFPMTIDDLTKATALEREEIYGALGWLGRENKILVERCGELRYFSARP